MSLTCLSQTELHDDGGSSDKIYIIQVQQDDSTTPPTYRTVGYYGRRGATLSRTEKYAGTSKASADAAATRLSREKTGKGYHGYAVPATGIPGLPSGTPVFGGASTPSPSALTAAAPSASAPTSTFVGLLPMLAEDTTEERVYELIDDPRYAFQKKYDGERVPVSMRRNGLQASNRKGAPRPLTTNVEKALSGMLAKPDFGDERETGIDGELMGDEYIAYDIAMLRDNDVRKLSYIERYSAMEELFEGHEELLAPTAWTPAEKRAMLEQAIKEDWEGIIIRDIESPYVTGKTLNLLRFKLWAMCTCRVLTVNAKRSVRVALLDDVGNETFVGNVTVPANQDIPEPDDLVEVRYLYAMEGGSLYQPTLLRVRTDVDTADLRSALRQAPPEKRGESAAIAAVEEETADI